MVGAQRAAWFHRGAAKTAALILLPLCVSLLAGCGTSRPAGTGSQAGVTFPNTTSSLSAQGSARPAKATGTAPLSRSISFTFTSPAGWTYKGSVPFPTVQLAATNDISSSPPGQAQLNMALSVTPEGHAEYTFSTSNPGRPNGPELRLIYPYLVWAVRQGPATDIANGLSSVYQSGFDNWMANEQDPTCDISTFYGNSWTAPATLSVGCLPLDGTSLLDATVPESDVNAVIASLHEEQPGYLMAFNMRSDCQILISPTGAVTLEPHWNANHCGTVLVSVVGGSGSPLSPNTPVPTRVAPASIVSGVAGVTEAELAAAGSGGDQVIFVGKPGSGSSVVTVPNPVTLTKGNKPEIVYVGADSCSFCAATQWPLAIALSKFGTLNGLRITASSPYDLAPNTDALSLYKTTYSSAYLSLTEVDQTTNVCKETVPNPSPPPSRLCSGGYTPLQATPPGIQQMLSKYVNPPYFPASSAGGIPFLDLGGHFVEDGDPFPFTATVHPLISMQGLSWQQIVGTFSHPTSGVGQALLGAANHYIAVLCQLTNGKPGSVCATSAVKSIEAAAFA